MHKSCNHTYVYFMLNFLLMLSYYYLVYIFCSCNMLTCMMHCYIVMVHHACNLLMQINVIKLHVYMHGALLLCDGTTCMLNKIYNM